MAVNSAPLRKLKVVESIGGKASLGEPKAHIIVVDDEPVICQLLKRLYTKSGYSVTIVMSANEALERLERRDIDLVVTDVRLPDLNGLELTKRIQQNHPDVPVIVITGYADVKTAIEALKLGASDYIKKPFSAAAIQESTRLILEKAHVFTQVRHLRQSLKDGYEFGGMLSKSPEMHRAFEIIRSVSSTDMTVAIEGETGTGKELVASAIHHNSPRRDGPLVTINCGGFPDTLLESELYGYERGAFTGAVQARPGQIELAHGGTLFLDEIESMSLAMQANLLRVLEGRKVQRLGGSRTVQIDMRVIVASNIPLEDLVGQGRMRSDFYYRISVISINLVPLRQRCEDIPLLVHDLLHHHPVATSKGITGISRHVLSDLMKHAWPGNIRELQNVLERAIVLTAGGNIERVHLKETKSSAQGSPTTAVSNSPTSSLKEWLNEQEKQYLTRQLANFGGKVSPTARGCGIDEKTLYRKMCLHGIDKKDFQ